MNGGPLPEHVLHGGATPEELTREPFYDGPSGPPPQSVTRPVGRGRAVNTTTGEVTLHWAPRTRGPLPDDWQEHYPDVNLATAQDELDLWAAEAHARAVEYERHRKQLARAKHAYEKAAAMARRRAKASPETGRRTVADLDAEVTERTDQERAAYYDAEAACDSSSALMFAAKDQMRRLEKLIDGARIVDPGP